MLFQIQGSVEKQRTVHHHEKRHGAGVKAVDKAAEGHGKADVCRKINISRPGIVQRAEIYNCQNLYQIQIMLALFILQAQPPPFKTFVILSEKRSFDNAVAEQSLCQSVIRTNII